MMDPRCRRFIEACLLLDLETTYDGRLRRIGAVLDGHTFERQGRFSVAAALADLDSFAAPAQRVLGHNLLGHDFPFLDGLAPHCQLLRKPVVDTLYLSPLAFPKNPYHPLIKHYKDDTLLREAESDPVADAQLAARAFELEWEEFVRLTAQDDLAPAVFRYCLSAAPGRASGLGDALAAAGAPRLGGEQALKAIERLAAPHACASALSALLRELDDGTADLPPLAFCLSWLRVAGADSILPHWVRHQFQGVSRLVKRLRDTSCADPQCAYCCAMYDPVGQLRSYFGLEGFVPKPCAADGTSLQAAITRAGLAERPVLALVPTGGGKSIGYQLPALARYRRRGALTVVISPLQALMKDQVEGLNQRTQGHLAAAIYGMLTPPERAAVLARVRLGDVAILYVSPEQLRNRSLRGALHSRELGCWVFDEAHCLSHWGHDFRPDYQYASRFIRELAAEQHVPVPPVACFTATAKRDVKAEILSHFQVELGQSLELFEAGVGRDNLRFEVRVVEEPQKLATAAALLRETLGLDGDTAPLGSAIVYFATRSATEEAAAYLSREGLPAEPFHAGLEPPLKQRVQDDFLAGTVPIICATNAFGMGIDKPDVRLVVHADVPGTLENYLQEAGRAGRDRGQARCVLLYSAPDVEKQFRLLARAQLSRRDIAAILKGLKRARPRGQDEVVITTGDLLRDEEVDTSFDVDDHAADTKVKIGIAWLERAGLIERNENQTSVFQGRPRVKSLAEAEARIATIHPPLAPAARERWLALLAALMNTAPDEGLSADDLSLLPAVDRTLPRLRVEAGETPGKAVLESLLAMVRHGLIEDGLLCTAYVRWKVTDSAARRLERLAKLDAALIGLLREESPDAESGHWQSLSLRRINQRLLDGGHDSDPDAVRRLLKSLEWDGRGMAGSRGSIDLRYIARDHYQVRLQRSWELLAQTAERRRSVARVALETILGRIPAGQPAGAEVQVSFALGDIARAVDADLVLRSQVRDPLKAIERALTFLHEQKVILLQQGLAVFRQAMVIRFRPESHGRGYTIGSHEGLANHYEERIFQVHVMDEYARLGAAKVESALRLVAAYFAMDKAAFVREYFAGRREILERATTQESYRRIVDSLHSSAQTAIVAAPADENLLVLAGPGAGKTRVVVHRVAWLVRVKRVPPRSILVVAFNRSAVLEIRRRLADLIDEDARGVTVQTYHGLALRLTGRSLAGALQRGAETLEFDRLIEEALRILRPGGDTSLEPDADRDRALAGYSHILVDEYQDIDERQYQLISALAGRTVGDPERKLAIFAVGDDDQNIYAFRAANVEFIRRFAVDYAARPHFLVENYRSTAHIVATANMLIAPNRDRMKTEHPIRVDGRRAAKLPAGGAWEARDPLTRGRVQIMTVRDRLAQGAAVRDELLRIRELDGSVHWSGFAVLARHRTDLEPVRAVLESAGIPVRRSVSRDKMPPVLRLREMAAVLDALRAQGATLCSGSDLGALRPATACSDENNPWLHLLDEVIAAWITETAGTPQPARDFADYLVESLIEQRREQMIGNGVLLSTIHGAKGMEFPHVLVLDGGGAGDGHLKGTEEEERRVLYVAVTRARATLCLLQRRDTCSPFLPALQGDFVLRRSAPAPLLPTAARSYEVLALTELYVDYAARFSPDHPLHLRLRNLRPGAAVRLEERDGSIGVLDADGYWVAQLSRSGVESWRPRLPRVRAAHVIAIVRRRADDGFPDYVPKSPSWELPVIEVELAR